MRIVTLVNSLNAGGAETALFDLVAATRDRFEHVIVALIPGGPLTSRFRNLGVQVIEGSFARGRLPVLAFPALVRKVAPLRPDLLVGCMYHAAVFAALLRPLLRHKPPLVWIIHHSPDRLAAEGRSTRFAILTCRLLSRRPRKIVFVSQRASGQHTGLGFPPERALVIPNGYDLDRYRPDAAARKRLRAEWDFGDDDVVVGHMARVHPMKDHANMLKALDLAAAREPRLAAVFCGKGTDALDVPAALASRVRVLGFRADVPAVMNACDVGCLSSSFGEAFPNVLAEFLSCARPCVATDVGDSGLIVDRFGKIVPPRDPKRLADALVTLAQMNEAERAVLGAAGRRSVAERFEIRGVAERHVALWRDAARAAR